MSIIGYVYKDEKVKILITQIYCYASIAIAKLLKNKSTLNAEIWGCDCGPIGYVSGSLLVDIYISTPNIHETNYVDYIKEIYINNQIDFIISVDEEELLIFRRKNLDKECKLVLPSTEILELFMNKLEASLKISQLGIKIPPVLTDLSQASKIIFRKKKSVGSQGIYIVDLKKAIFIENHFNKDEFIQEYIEGEEYTVDIFSDKHGIPKLIIPRLRLEIRNGMSFKTKLIYDEQIIQKCKTILAKYKIPGLCNIQIIKNSNDIFFIELNPRFAGSGIASNIASFNYIELYIKHFLLNYQLRSYDHYMDKVVWNAVITKYYEELILYP